MAKVSESDRADFWEKQARKHARAEEYYRDQLAKAHEILGRVLHQHSEVWDTVRLTKYYPTDNLHGFRSISNPSGDGPLGDR